MIRDTFDWLFSEKKKTVILYDEVNLFYCEDLMKLGVHKWVHASTRQAVDGRKFLQGQYQKKIIFT